MCDAISSKVVIYARYIYNLRQNRVMAATISVYILLLLLCRHIYIYKTCAAQILIIYYTYYNTIERSTPKHITRHCTIIHVWTLHTYIMIFSGHACNVTSHVLFQFA